MYLEKIVIKNFCSCSDLSINLSSFNPIIGYNNSGKSNILKAVSWLLKKSVLPANYFYDVDEPVSVEGVINGVNLALLPPNQQATVAPLIVDGKLTVRRFQSAPGVTTAQVKIDVFNHGIGDWVVNPTGLDNAIAVLFPEPLYIQAMDDSAEDVGKFGPKNTIGLLLKSTFEQIRLNNAQALQTVQNSLSILGSHLNGAGRIDQLNTLENDATTAIGDFFPGITFHLDIKEPAIDDLIKGATISLCDQPGTLRPIGSFGHGAQRSVQMALIKLLSSQVGQAARNGGVTVLLIDEPELYLHPQAIELLREALRTLASQNFQVIFSTHSPLLIGKDDVLNTAMVLKVAGSTSVRQKLSDAARVIAGNPHQASVIFSIQHATYLLFSETVVLVEGKTEKMIFPDLYKTVRGHSLGYDKACVVEASGSSSIFPMMTILEQVGFRPKAIVDLDYVFKVAPGLALVVESDADFVACKAWFAANTPAQSYCLGADGFPTRKDNLGRNAQIAPEAAFELLAAALPNEIERLVNSLLARGIWVWKKGAIEPHLGIPMKNDGARMQFISDMISNGNIHHAADSVSVENCIAWLN